MSRRAVKDRYQIVDWAGNVLDYTGVFIQPSIAVPMEFGDFDDAAEWLDLNVEEDDREDLYIEKLEN